MSYPKDELSPPRGALADERAFELARLWFVDGELRCEIREELWPDPAAWGMVIGELARRIAAGYADEAMGPDVALDRLRAGFDAELAPLAEGS